MHCFYTDPVTFDALTRPLLASDGYTYNASTLEQLMGMDAWHRSPLTKEVLRPWAFPNAIVSTSMGVPVMAATRLYDEEDPTLLPIDGRPVCLGLPQELTCDEEIKRHMLGLPPERIMLVAKLWRDGPSHTDMLMHPPCPDCMRTDMDTLAKLFGLNRLVPNPWCLSTAVLQWAGVHTTVEAWWQGQRL